MRDSIVKVTVVGIIGGLVLDAMMYLLILLGIETASPWSVAADIFLAPPYINTASGIIIGLVGTVALSIATAFLLLLVFRWTGYDFAILKGIVATDAFAFIMMGLFMPLLKIAPQVQKQPVTNYAALLSLTLAGAVMALVLKRFHRIVE